MSWWRSIVSALSLPFQEAIDFFRQKTNVTSTGWTDVFGRANAKSFTVAGAATQALVGDFRREVMRALEDGVSLQDFRGRFDEIVRKHGWSHSGQPGWRARVVYETNLSMAYSAGRYVQMTEPETVAAFPYWQYVHSGARHPRKQHLEWNGTVLRADDPFWDWAYPPNGWGCGCRVRPLSERGLERQGRRGPDQAPERLPVQTVNKKTGEVLTGSHGVDIGFDHNPGQVWKNAPGASVAGLSPRPSAAASMPPTSAETMGFAQDVLAGKIVNHADSVVAARLPEDLADILGGGRREIELSAFRVLKVAGRAAEVGGKPSNAHPEIGAYDWARLQHIVQSGTVHLDAAQRGRHRQLIFHWSDPADRKRQLMLIVRRVPRPGGGERLIIPNFEQTGERRRKRVTAKLREIRK
jgi:hypothetical protein